MGREKRIAKHAGMPSAIYVIVTRGPAGVELHVELPFFACQFIVLGLFLP